MARVPKAWSRIMLLICACGLTGATTLSAQAAPVEMGAIAYVAPGQGIYVLTSGASSPRRLTSGAPSDDSRSLAWSADGRWLAFSQNGLTVVDSTSGSDRKLTNQADTSPSWDAAGNLWFRRGGELYRTRMNGSPQRVETKCLDGPGEISADGKSFVYTTGDEIHVCGTDNVVPDRVVAAAKEGQQLRGPRWSPDARRILYFVPERDGEWGLYVADVTPGSDSEHLGEGASPDWSPDGKTLVFTQDERLMLANADGSQRRNVTAQGGNVSGSSPAWGKKYVQSAKPKPPADDGSRRSIPDRSESTDTDSSDADAGATAGDAEPAESPDGSEGTAKKDAEKKKGGSDKDAQAAPGEFVPPVTTEGPDRRWLIAGLIGGLAMIGGGSGIAFWLLRQRGVG